MQSEYLTQNQPSKNIPSKKLYIQDRYIQNRKQNWESHRTKNSTTYFQQYFTKMLYLYI